MKVIEKIHYGTIKEAKKIINALTDAKAILINVGMAHIYVNAIINNKLTEINESNFSGRGFNQAVSKIKADYEKLAANSGLPYRIEDARAGTGREVVFGNLKIDRDIQYKSFKNVTLWTGTELKKLN